MLFNLKVIGEFFNEVNDMLEQKGDNDRTKANNAIDNGFLSKIPIWWAVMTSNTSIMQEAILKGNSEVVKMLIKAGANLDLKNGLGYTALMRAVEREHKEIVAMLEKAHKNKKDDKGMLTEEYGGIDLKGIEIEKKGRIDIKFDFSAMNHILNKEIKGIQPVIINFVPVVDVYQFLGLRKEDEEKDYEKV